MKQGKSHLIAELALGGSQKAIDFSNTRMLSGQLRLALPTIERVEHEMSADPTTSRWQKNRRQA